MIDFDRPKFITFEGGEGSGKSTQSKMLYEFLISKRINAIHTREVGGTPEAEKIRNILLHSELFATSELMLVMAARYEHINKVIIPALLEGKWVICDRYVDSSACYQSGDSGLTIDDIFELHSKLMRMSYDNEVENTNNKQFQLTHDDLMPDMTFFMDVPPSIGLARVEKRGDINKFEEKHFAFHKNIYEKFKIIADSNKDRVITVQCVDKTIDEIHKIIIDSIFH
ncbi:MAG: dTMP kinase [Rickettsiales bacterium]|nr:MAG: dTMP kinase [Rickettsiales bacterium]